ncbi:hypothetical protein N7540_003484 [Penicillium herquei]|nr:hypothetical protein N7540_003484 [Penicillium herquei]
MSEIRHFDFRISFRRGTDITEFIVYVRWSNKYESNVIAHQEDAIDVVNLAKNLQSTQAGLQRRRCARSCISCRRRKEKCSGGATCARCTKKGIECLYFDTTTEDTTESDVEIQIPELFTAASLPSEKRVRRLVDIYFIRIHTVRCMGFLHIPSFMKCIKDPTQMPSERSGLLHAMCALAAPFYCAEILGINEEQPQKEIFLFEAGKGWAEVARRILFSTFGKPHIDTLMTEVLLHEHYLRVGEYAQGFMLSGQIARHLQVMQLNLESDSDVLCEKGSYSPSTKESRRRLAWACYILDAYIECGIDQLRFITSKDLQVQLPCLEDMFIRSIPCITETLSPGKFLPFLDPSFNTDFSGYLDLRSFYIRGISIRSQILKFVKHLEGEVPWHVNEDSKFAQLDRTLHDFEISIPHIFKMSPENVCIFKAAGRLNLFFGLHILISQNFYDLYRVGVSSLVFPDTATKWIRENAPSAFIRECHLVCLRRATHIASLLKDIWECDKASLVDTPYAMHTQVCSSVLVTSLRSWKGNDNLLPEVSLHDYRKFLRTNVEILQYLQQYMKADMYCESAMNALDRFNEFVTLNSATSEPRALESDENMSSLQEKRPRILPLEQILNPLGTYPMARKQALVDTQRLYGDAESPAGLTTSETMAEAQTDITVGIDAYSSPTYQFWDNFDWESEMFLIQGLGYPTFLGQEI